MKRLRMAVATAVVLATTLVTSACGGAKQDDSKTADLGLITPGTISVATIGDNAPYTTIQKDGTYSGFDLEFFKNVVKRIGIDEDKIQFTSTDMAAILPGVVSKKYDVGVAAIGITPERKKTVDFSNGYLVGYLGGLTKDASLKDLKKLSGKRVGIVQGGLTEKWAAKALPDSKIVRFPDQTSAVSGVKSGSVDMYFMDYEAGKKYNGKDGMSIPIRVPSFDAPAGFAVRKGDDSLRKALNKGIEEAMKDGTWVKLYKQWFPGSPVPPIYKADYDRTKENEKTDKI